MNKRSNTSNAMLGKAFDSFKDDLLDELEDRMWPRFEQRIDAALFHRNLTVYEAAKYLRVSHQTVRRLITALELPCFRVRNQIFLRLSDIDSWIETQIASPQSPFEEE